MSGRSLDDLGYSLSWRDLHVLVERWQRTPGTATCASVQGVEHWTVSEQLLATILDALNTGNWQRGQNKNSPKPKRIPRPWEQPQNQRLGSDPIPIHQFNDWWDKNAQPRPGR